ncbi:MAG: SDR family NAD(P)-dependent oxidoreductase, partial [Chloroflexota bacterium]
EQLVPALDALSTTHAVLALQELGWQPSPGQRFSTAALANQLGILPRHLRELGRLLQCLEEDGVLRRADDVWEVRAQPTVLDPGPVWAALRTRFPAARGEIDLTERCGQNLAAALTGRVDPLELLFPGGSLQTTEHLYQESPILKAYNTALQACVRAALAALPTGRRLRVLEIGAGTGGTASHLLPLLPADRTEYVFTDVSPLFLARAEEKFSQFPFVRYQLLDISRDLTGQGLEAGQFDLVVAANVLHATPDLAQTLTHARQLAAPGGLLLLLENTSRQRWADLTFGLTEGWWNFRDLDLRPDYPLMSADAWLKLLERVGFEDVVVAPSPAEAGGAPLQDLLLARAPRAAASAVGETGSSEGDWLILADSHGVGDKLAAALSARGEASVLVRPGPSLAETAPGRWTLDPGSRADFERLVRTASSGHWRGVMHLWSLDGTPAGQTTVATLEQDSEVSVGSALNIVQALARTTDREMPRLFLVTRGAQPIGAPGALDIAHAPLWGLGRTIDLEHPELRCVRIDLDPAPGADVVSALLAEALSSGGENQIGHRDGARFAARLVHRELAPSAPVASAAAEQAVHLAIPEPGVLDSLTLKPEPRRVPGPGEVEIRIRAIGLNFKDVLIALNMLEGQVAEAPVGYDCAGEIVAVGAGVTDFRVGDAVFGPAPGCMGSHITVAAAPLQAKPDFLTFEDAAAIPSAYLTAYYGLHTLAGLAAGERVLIHAAAGGVGLAAVQLARRAGAEIFATAGSPEKRDYLASLGVQHILNSRSLDFAEQVKELTGGRGVDVVLNSLAGDFITKTVDVLAEDGRFVELGQTGIWTREQVAAVKPRATYHVPVMTDEVANNPGLMATLLGEIVSLFTTGALVPLPRRDFPLTDAVSAFRHMAQARHIGKIVLTLPAPAGPLSESRPAVRPDGTYLVTGGLRGLGPLVAKRLAAMGARHLALVGRREPAADTRALISALEGQGVRVAVILADVSQPADVARVLETIDETMPPLRGIVHSAGVLDDGILLQQNWDRFRTVMSPKVDGSWLLHTLTAGRDLDFFTLFSTSVAVLGAAGQGNHAAANAFLDALAHHRRALGQPATSINWGPWTEVGAASERNLSEHFMAQGYGGIPVEVGLDIFEDVLTASPAQVAVLPIQWSRYLERSEGRRGDPFFTMVAAQREVAPSAPAAAEPASQPRILQDLAEATPTRQRALLIEYVQGRAAGVLGADVSRMDARRPLNELGLDSLTAVELRNLLGRGLDLKRALPATLVYDYPTVEAIADYLARDVLALTAAPEAAGVVEIMPAPARSDDGVVSLLDSLDDLSDEEVEQLLTRRLSGG